MAKLKDILRLGSVQRFVMRNGHDHYGRIITVYEDCVRVSLKKRMFQHSTEPDRVILIPFSAIAHIE